MPVIVPESVFDKYYDVIDSTFDIFGVNCQLVSINKVEEIVNIPNNNIPEKNSVNAHRVRGGDYERSQTIVREIEVLTPIKLKVYWDPRQWVNTSAAGLIWPRGDMKIPDGSIETIGFMSDLPKVLSAKALIVHDGIKNIKEQRFERYGEHAPMGLRQNRYFVCLWRRV
jgi:hypothetical protein